MGRQLRDSQFLVLFEKNSPKGYNVLDFSFELTDGKRFGTYIQDKPSDVFCLNGKVDFSLVDIYMQFNIHMFPVGGLHKFDTELENIANNSTGTKWLGVLRMDVDNLGKIFAEGFRNYSNVERYIKTIEDRKRFNFYFIGRVTTLSTQLTVFFSYILNHIIDNNEK